MFDNDYSSFRLYARSLALTHHFIVGCDITVRKRRRKGFHLAAWIMYD